MLRYDDSIDSCSFGCASYRAEVSYVGNTVEEHHKGEHAIFVELCGEMVEPVVCDRRQDRQHTLMVFACYAVDLFNGHALHEDTVAPGKVKKFAGI